MALFPGSGNAMQSMRCVVPQSRTTMHGRISNIFHQQITWLLLVLRARHGMNRAPQGRPYASCMSRPMLHKLHSFGGLSELRDQRLVAGGEQFCKW